MRRKTKLPTSTNTGVTLVELLIVVSIIGFLGAMVLTLTGQTQFFKSRDARRKGDIKRLQTALEDYASDNECYPTVDLMVCNTTNLSPYIQNIPCDPKTKESYLYEPQSGTCPTWYRLYVNLENDQDPAISKVGCTNGCGPGQTYNYWFASPNAPKP